MPDSTPASPAPTSATLDAAFAALATYDQRSGRAALLPLDQAVAASIPNATAREPLEQRLAALLKQPISRVAKEYVCSKLALIGSPHSVPFLAPLLGDQALSDAARASLQAMPCREAVDALRAAAPKVTGLARIGVIQSLGSRQDQASVPMLGAWLKDADIPLATAAAAALGEIGSAEAAEFLAQVPNTGPEPLRLSVAHARLICAERLLAAGEKTAASTIYQNLGNSAQPKQIQLAAKRGLLLVLQQK